MAERDPTRAARVAAIRGRKIEDESGIQWVPLHPAERDLLCALADEALVVRSIIEETFGAGIELPLAVRLLRDRRDAAHDTIQRMERAARELAPAPAPDLAARQAGRRDRPRPRSR